MSAPPNPARVSANDALARLSGSEPAFNTIIDARSEGEFALDCLPGAVNWPSLNDSERAHVGTLYKQVSPFEAQKIGAALVAANIGRHIHAHVLNKPRDWQALVYCWRGGKRSGSLALVLAQIGFKVAVLEGGYKAFRTAMLADLPQQVARLVQGEPLGGGFRVVCGTTGSGKTRLLAALQAAGAQVLDLEALANHRSSVLGQVPGQPQPGQKQFEMRVWHSLSRFDPARPVFVESESKKVGNVAVPDALITAMRASACLRLTLPDDERVALLLEDYDHFVRDPALLSQRLDTLVGLRGKAVVGDWKAQIAAGQLDAVVRELLVTHYDPGYLQSIQRNFSRYGDAKLIAARARHACSMAELASEILRDDRSEQPN